MFNMGFTEMLFVAGLALILIGPKQLPEVARTLGRFLNELRRSTGSLTEDLRAQTDFDRRTVREAALKKLNEGNLPPPPATEDKKT